MALPLGKLTVLVGAGIVGSVLAKEGRMSNVSDFFSGALKIVFKQIKKDDATTLRAKPPNDSLLAQVNSLRQELQLLASNRPITVVASTGSGGSRYGVIVVVLIVGYGYVWWKIVLIGLGSELPDILIDLANRVLTLVIACQNMGWKLPDLMFATRRSLSEASSKIAKELENVYSSISATKRHLSSKIDRVDSSLDEFAELTAATQGEVSELRGNMKVVGGDVRSVRHAVQTLETKLNRIEGKQNYTVENVVKLVDVAWTLENSRMKERIQATPSSSSMPALELPQSGSLTPTSTLELPSPSASDESHKVKLHLQSAVSASGLKELHGISDVQEPSRSPEVSNGVHVTEDTNPNNSSSGVFGRRLSGLSAAFISRTYSAMPSFK